jgi:hypothetical protein
MAFVEIPVDGAKVSQAMRIALAGVVFNLDYYYNERSDTWYCDIKDDAGNDLVSGVKMVPDVGLIERFGREDLPQGEMYAFDSTGLGTPPDRDSFGLLRRVKALFDR